VLDPEVAQRYQEQSAAAISSNPYTEMLASYNKENGREGQRGRGRFNSRRGGRKDYVPQPGQQQGATPDAERKGGRGRYPKRGTSPTPHGQNKSIRPNQSASLTQWWPPLPSGEQVEVCGYTKEFQKYSKDQIVAIISSIKEKTPVTWNAKNSEALRPENDPIPPSELLKLPPKDAKVEWVETKRRASNTSKPPYASSNQNHTKNPTKSTPEENKWASLLQNNGKKPS